MYFAGCVPHFEAQDGKPTETPVFTQFSPAARCHAQHVSEFERNTAWLLFYLHITSQNLPTLSSPKKTAHRHRERTSQAQHEVHVSESQNRVPFSGHPIFYPARSGPHLPNGNISSSFSPIGKNQNPS